MADLEHIPYLRWTREQRDYLMLLATGMSHEQISSELQEQKVMDKPLDLRALAWWRKDVEGWAYAEQQVLSDGLWFHRHIGRRLAIAQADALNSKYMNGKNYKGISSKIYELWLTEEGMLNQTDKKASDIADLLVQKLMLRAQAAQLPEPEPLDVTPVSIKEPAHAD